MKNTIKLSAATAAVLMTAPAFAQENKAYSLNEVVVTATRTPHSLKDVPVETAVVNSQDIQKSNAENVMDALKAVPGIDSSVHDDVFGIYTWRASMRGLNFNDGYGLVLIDGQRVMGCGQSGGMGEYGIGLNQLPLDMVERIEVVKGPSSALYGSDAMAGVVNIITKDTPDKPSGRAGVSYGLYSIKDKENEDGTSTPASDDSRSASQAYFSFGDRPAERFGYLLGYNYEAAEDVSQDPIESFRHSLTAKTTFSPSERLDLSLKGDISSYEKEDNRDEDSWRIAPGMEWKLADEQTLAVKGYTYTWDFVHGSPGYEHGYKHGTIGFNQAEAQHTWQINEQNTLVLGSELQRQGIDYTIENPGGSIIRVDEEIDTFSLYGQDELLLFDNLTLVGGLRYDDHSVFGSEINPKLSAMFNLSDTTTLRASAGRSFKSPTIRQLYYDVPYQHGDFYIQSNRELQPETGIGYSAALEQWLFDGQLVTNLGLFRNDIDEMVIQEDTDELYDGLPLRRYQNVDEAVIQGLELSARWEWKNFSLGAAYTYTDSENKDTGLNLTYVPEHSLSLTPAYTWSQYGLGVSGTVSCVGKQYKDNENLDAIGSHSVVDTKVYKEIDWKDMFLNKAVLSVSADNIFDSEKGDAANFRTGRAFMLKLDLNF